MVVVVIGVAAWDWSCGKSIRLGLTHTLNSPPHIVVSNRAAGIQTHNPHIHTIHGPPNRSTRSAW